LLLNSKLKQQMKSLEGVKKKTAQALPHSGVLKDNIWVRLLHVNK